jgi:hypothetical protein
MTRDIVFKIAVPRWPRRRWTLLCVTTLVLGSGAVVYATVPNVFSAGDLLSAQKLNDNFAALVDRSSDQTIAGSKTFSSTALFAGKVGIGTANPGFPLHVSSGSSTGTDANILRLESTASVPRQWDINIKSGKLVLGDNTVTADRLTVDTNGNIGVGTVTPQYALDVVGTIRGTNVSPSDARLKTNVRTVEHALDQVVRLRGVTFTWKKDGQRSIGVIAQEVERVLPELVSTAPDGEKAVDYGKVAGVLIEATKELRTENETLKARLERIEAHLDRRAMR